MRQLPEIAAIYVNTTNGNNSAGFIALFDQDAVVDDAGRMIHGRKAIQEWAASDIFAANVTLEVMNAREDQDVVTLTAQVDGTFDRTGLPDPLIMTLEILPRNGKISRLTCRLADRSDPGRTA